MLLRKYDAPRIQLSAAIWQTLKTKRTGNKPSPPLGPQTFASGSSQRISFSTRSYSIRRTYTDGSSLKKCLRVLGTCNAVERWMKPDRWSRSLTGSASGKGSGMGLDDGTNL